MTFVQTQLQKFLNDILKQSAKLRKGGEELVYHCPFCNENKKVPKLEICVLESSPVFQNWNCWICHTSGKSIRSFLIKLRAPRSSISELFNILPTIGIHSNQPSEVVEIKKATLPYEFQPFSKISDSYQYKLALRYLKNRSVSKTDILRRNIGYCETGKYNRRIVIPSYDKNGDLNFFTARAYDDNSYKYMLPDVSKDCVGDELLINFNEDITLVEGHYDAIAVRKNAIPLFGTSMSTSLKNAILTNGVERVNICLDNDSSGIRGSMVIYNFLKGFDIDARIIKLNGKDPASVGFENVNKAIINSMSTEFSDIIKMKLQRI